MAVNIFYGSKLSNTWIVEATNEIETTFSLAVGTETVSKIGRLTIKNYLRKLDNFLWAFGLTKVYQNSIKTVDGFRLVNEGPVYVTYNKGKDNRRFNYAIYEKVGSEEHAAKPIKGDVVDDEKTLDSSTKSISDSSQLCSYGYNLVQHIRQYLQNVGTWEDISKLIQNEASLSFLHVNL